jgi:hypothetical protein
MRRCIMCEGSGKINTTAKNEDNLETTLRQQTVCTVMEQAS